MQGGTLPGGLLASLPAWNTQRPHLTGADLIHSARRRGRAWRAGSSGGGADGEAAAEEPQGWGGLGLGPEQDLLSGLPAGAQEVAGACGSAPVCGVLGARRRPAAPSPLPGGAQSAAHGGRPTLRCALAAVMHDLLYAFLGLDGQHVSAVLLDEPAAGGKQATPGGSGGGGGQGPPLTFAVLSGAASLQPYSRELLERLTPLWCAAGVGRKERRAPCA